MFYVILTIVILVVFGTILNTPKQSKEQKGGSQELDNVTNSIEQLDNLRLKIEELKGTIETIAPKLPAQSNVFGEIQTTLTTFQADFFKTLDNMASNVETQLT